MGSMPKLSIIKGEQFDFKVKRLHRIIEDNLNQQAQKIALIYDGGDNENNGNTCRETVSKTQSPRQTTYRNWNHAANQCARLLVTEKSKRFLQPNADGDHIIAVCMQPSDRLVTTLLAIWKAGAAYLPIDPTFPANRIQHILREAQPIFVIRDDDVDENRFGAVPTFSVSELLAQSKELDATNLLKAETLDEERSDLAIVLYTSGSTGIPKGVRLPHRVILNRLQWQWNVFPYAPNENVGVFKTALTFVDSVSELWSPLLNGLAVLVVPKHITKDPERLVDLLEEYKIRRLVLVPTLLRSLLMYLDMLKSPANKGATTKILQNLHIWVCSGEPLPVALASSFFDYFEEGVHSLFNFYGSTEVMGDVTYFRCESKKQLAELDRVPIGLPVFNTVIYLLDSDYRPVKNGEIGEIFVSGLNLANSYVNGRDPDKFLENPLAVEGKYGSLYRTGDYGSVDNDGQIMYEGRTDSQIKIRGHRVDLAEVEKQISDMAMVDKSIVLCYHPGQMDQALLAFVKLRDNAPLTNELQMEAKLKSKLADYMTPQVILIEQVPLLVNGKVDRQSLLKLYETANNNEGDCSIVLDFDYSKIPENLMTAARDLFETVGSVIGRSTRAVVAPESNFYELGGNSLNSIFTVTLLREKGYHISISDFIAAKNLGEVLKKITNTACKKSDDEPSVEEWLTAAPHLDMEVMPLHSSHRETVISMIVESFYNKAELEQLLKPNIYPKDYDELFTDIWNDLESKNLSFVVRDRNTNKLIGCALNFDARDEPEVEVRSQLIVIFEFLEYLEGPIRDNYLPKGLNKILHSFMMCTSDELNAQENISCMDFMENEVLKLAKRRNFVGILTTNTSPLTQQLGSDVYHYKTLLDYQINEYVYTDGSRPFAKAPDSQRAIVHWKEVGSN